MTMSDATLAPDPLEPGLLSFMASNITGTQSIPIDVAGGLSVRAVTDSIAERMALPDDVTWALRDDDSSVYLDEGRPIGEQIAPGAKLTISPRTHLGGGVIRLG